MSRLVLAALLSTLIAPASALTPQSLTESPLGVRPPAPPAVPQAGPKFRFGMTVEPLETFYGRGWVITNVQPFSPVAKAGLETGDVVLMADGRSLDVASKRQAAMIVQSAIQVFQVPRSPSEPGLVMLTSTGPPVTHPETRSVATVDFTVINSRNGEVVNVTVQPKRANPLIAGPVAPGSSVGGRSLGVTGPLGSTLPEACDHGA